MDLIIEIICPPKLSPTEQHDTWQKVKIQQSNIRKLKSGRIHKKLKHILIWSKTS